VGAPDFARPAAPDETIEKRIASPAAVRDRGKGRVLARHAEAGMPHHDHEEPRLALCEAQIHDRLDTLSLRRGPLCARRVGDIHRHNSSANPPLRPPPLPPPDRPEIRTPHPP